MRKRKRADAAAVADGPGKGLLGRAFAASKVAGMGGILAMLLAIPALVVAETWIGRVRTEQVWTIDGPACPVVQKPERRVVGTKRKPRTMTFQGVTFTRWFGHVSCLTLPEGGFFNDRRYPVCQFSGPGAVQVTAGGRTVIYQPGVAKRATVKVVGGQPSCVVAGWFRY